MYVDVANFNSNKAIGVNATAAVNAFADRLTREWLIKPVETIQQ